MQDNKLLIPYIITLLLGCKHAMDGDHLLATANYLVRSKSVKDSVWTITQWVIGHQSTATPIAALALGFGVRLLPTSEIFEATVGITLVLIGVIFLLEDVEVLKAREHVHEHTHGEGSSHSHSHVHRFWPLTKVVHRFHRHKHAQLFVIGAIHGLASNDETVATITILTGLWIRHNLSETVVTFLSVISFTLGLLLGMFVFAAAVSKTLTRSNKSIPTNFIKTVRISVETLTALYGLLMILKFL